MSRMLPSAWMFLACAVVWGLCTATLAQERSPGARSPGAGSFGEQPPVAPRGANANGLPRPEVEELRIEPVTPEMDAVLRAWELASSKIQKLQGLHKRFVYDHVFCVEKRSDGIFYYEAPDKGRIDIAPGKIDKDEVSRKVDPKTGKPYQLSADRAERWICTGQEILQINDAEKTYELFPIPPQHQGANIMEGPLPFLFGMPAEKAKRRFKLTLESNTPEHARIKAIPRMKADASQYREARIILDKTDSRYLPVAVQLVDPSGNTETTYVFSKLVVNKPRSIKDLFIGEKDPFHPDLHDYRLITPRVVAEVPAGSKPGAPGASARAPLPRNGNAPPPQEGPRRDRAPEIPQAVPGTVPNVVGFFHLKARASLEALGYEVKLRRGVPAKDEKQKWVVYDQEPKASTPSPKDKVVILTLFDAPAGSEPAERTSQK